MQTDTHEDISASASSLTGNATSKDFLTILIAGQRFGIPILQIQDVLGGQSVTYIPLAPPEVSGSLNLRGRIVTAINMRKSLGITVDEKAGSTIGVVVEYKNELYSLIIDEIGDVMSLDDQDFEKTPATLDAAWRDVASGIYRLEGELLVVLDVPKFIGSIYV